MILACKVQVGGMYFLKFSVDLKQGKGKSTRIVFLKFWYLILDSVLEKANFIMSSKGVQLVLDKARYIYYKQRINKDQTIYWKCQEHNRSCNAKVKTYNNNVIRYVGVHVHYPPDKESSRCEFYVWWSFVTTYT